MEMLSENGYVFGVFPSRTLSLPMEIEFGEVGITLRGLEYLRENSIMKKIANGLKETINIVK